MKRLLLFGALALALAGCKDFDKPRDVRGKERPDGSQYTIEEQQKRGRYRYGNPEDDVRIGPKGFNDRPSPTGR